MGLAPEPLAGHSWNIATPGAASFLRLTVFKPMAGILADSDGLLGSTSMQMY